jgi:hypothetical protein
MKTCEAITGQGSRQCHLIGYSLVELILNKLSDYLIKPKIVTTLLRRIKIPGFLKKSGIWPKEFRCCICIVTRQIKTFSPALAISFAI